MQTIDEVNDILGEIMDELPIGVFDKLNGGIVLSPELKIHPEAKGRDDLCIMGEYSIRQGLGRYVVIYYGSFMKLYPEVEREVLKKHLRKTLFHELTHHLEMLAGERGLEIQDEIDIANYRRQRGLVRGKEKREQ